MSTSKAIVNADLASGELCKRKLSRFVKEFWDVIVPNPLVWNWHMEVLCDEIQRADERVFRRQPKDKDVIINIPPGTSKTKIVSVLSTAWEFACKPAIKVFVGSYSDLAISSISDDIRLVMKSEKYKRYFPGTIIRKDRDTLHTFKTTSNGEFYAFTVGGTLTSKHADILKVDDPLNPKQAASAAELLTANTFFDKTLPTRKVDKEVTITYLVMQRLANNDPTGHLMDKKGQDIHHICLPGKLASNVKPIKYRDSYINGYLDPVRLGEKVLRELKIDLGSDGYSGQIDQNPVPEGGLIWHEWFIPVPDEYFPEIDQLVSYGNDWDLAYTKDDINAASAYVSAGKLKNDIYISDIGWAWKEFPELIEWMSTKTGTHYIEAKASGKSAKQTLVKAGINAVEVKVKGGDKIARAKMSTSVAESGRVYVRKSILDRLYNDSDQGILFFPKGKYADLADALAQCLQRLDKSKITMSIPTYREDDRERGGDNSYDLLQSL